MFTAVPSEKESCCEKVDPFQGSRAGFCLTLGNEFSETCADKAKDFIGKGHLGREQEGQGTQENSAAWLTVSGFEVMRLVSRLSLGNHSDSESLLVVLTWHCSAKTDSREEDSGRLVGHMDRRLLSLWPFLNSGWWFVSPAFLTRTSCCKKTQPNGYYWAWLKKLLI